MKRTAFVMIALLGALAACSEEAAAPEGTAASEQGGKAAGDVEGGTISDAMIPLESLRSQSPALEPSTTSVTTTTTIDADGETQTTVETTTVTTSGESAAPAPAPPVPPAAPGGRP